MIESLAVVASFLSGPTSPAAADRRKRLETSLVKRAAVRIMTRAVAHLENNCNLSAEIFDLLSRWLPSEPDFWTREVGQLWRAIRHDDDPAMIGSLVDLAIHASTSGIAGDWGFSVPRPRSIRAFGVIISSVRHGRIISSREAFRGEFKTPDAWVIVQMQRGQVSVEQLGGDQEYYVFASTFSTFGHQYHLVPSSLASPDLLPAHGRKTSAYSDELFVPAPPRAQTALLQAALELLNQSLPSAYEWTFSVVKDIIPLRTKNGAAGSTSSFWDWGMVGATLSDRISPALIAEMLVHEASHQHFFLAMQLGPIVDGADDRQYLSPMVNAPRSLEKMFLGYHALVNILLFYEGLNLLSREDYGSFSRPRIKFLFEKLDCIGPVVGGATSFADLGSSMLRHLQIEELRLRKYFSQSACLGG